MCFGGVKPGIPPMRLRSPSRGFGSPDSLTRRHAFGTLPHGLDRLPL